MMMQPNVFAQRGMPQPGMPSMMPQRTMPGVMPQGMMPPQNAFSALRAQPAGVAPQPVNPPSAALPPLGQPGMGPQPGVQNMMPPAGPQISPAAIPQPQNALRMRLGLQ